MGGGCPRSPDAPMPAQQQQCAIRGVGEQGSREGVGYQRPQATQLHRTPPSGDNLLRLLLLLLRYVALALLLAVALAVATHRARGWRCSVCPTLPLSLPCFTWSRRSCNDARAGGLRRTRFPIGARLAAAAVDGCRRWRRMPLSCLTLPIS